jgi:Icc-related predicted phosphoesterase
MTRVSTILCAADPRGSAAAVEQLGRAVEGRAPDAVVVVGDLSAAGAAASYRSVLHALARFDRPVYWVPGPGDAPLSAYVRESHAMENVHPSLHGVHATAAFTPGGHTVVAGLGGEIDDDPDAERDEHARLRYPRMEAEYRLKLLEQLGEHERMLLFWSRPAHKRLDPGGSETVADLVNTYRPRLVICGGAYRSERLGTSMVVAPGSLCEGRYAFVDLRSETVELAEPASVAGR